MRPYFGGYLVCLNILGRSVCSSCSFDFPADPQWPFVLLTGTEDIRWIFETQGSAADQTSHTVLLFTELPYVSDKQLEFDLDVLPIKEFLGGRKFHFEQLEILCLVVRWKH